jgi:hypothetical protein
MVYNKVAETVLVQWLMSVLSKGPNRVGVSLPSPEGRNRSSFRNVVFSSYLEFRKIDEVYKHIDSESFPFNFTEDPLQ